MKSISDNEISDLINIIVNKNYLDVNDLNLMIELHKNLEKDKCEVLENILRKKIKQINNYLEDDYINNLINMFFYRDGKSNIVDIRSINKREIAIIRSDEIELGDSLHNVNEEQVGFDLQEEAYLRSENKGLNEGDYFPPKELFTDFYNTMKSNTEELKRKLKITDDKTKIYFDRELGTFYFEGLKSFKVIVTELPNTIKVYEVNVIGERWFPIEINDEYINVSILQNNNPSISKINQIKYNQTIIDRKKQLLTELEQTQKQLSEQQEKCDHIRVCIGWNGPYLYRDTSICECLICGEKEPESNYPVIEAYDYKSELYSHGELESYRAERMSELQNLVLNIISKKEDITTEQLVEIMSDIIKNPIASKYANLAIACLQYPEVQLVNPEEQGPVKKLVPNNKK